MKKRQLPRSHRPPSPPTESTKQSRGVQTDPPPAVTKRADPVTIKSLWKKEKKSKRVYPREGSDAPVPRVGGRLRNRLQRLVRVGSNKLFACRISLDRPLFTGPIA